MTTAMFVVCSAEKAARKRSTKGFNVCFSGGNIEDRTLGDNPRFYDRLDLGSQTEPCSIPCRFPLLQQDG